MRAINILIMVFIIWSLFPLAQIEASADESDWMEILGKQYGIDIKESCPDETEEEVSKTVKKIWADMSSEMMAGNLEKALNYFSVFSKEEYRRRLSDYSKEELNSIFGDFEYIEIYRVDKDEMPGFGIIRVEAGVIRKEPSGLFSYPLRFVKDIDCSWKISGF
jgi:hypothetical protein